MIDRPHLWHASFPNVLRLAGFLGIRARARGDCRPACECVGCRTWVIEKVVRACQ